MTSNIRSIEQTLQENLPWHKARIKFVTRFLRALFAVQTVNLSALATAFSGSAKEESNDKRRPRFLRHFELPDAELAAFVVTLLGIQGPYTLALDRTNWKIGSTDIHLLMLSLVYRGVGFPVVWLLLPTAGHSHTIERETVWEIFIQLFGAPNIACLLGEREFVGKRWFDFLKQHRINFQLRLKKDTPVCNGRGQLVPAWRLFAATRIHQVLVIPEARRMWGMELFLSGGRLADGEWLILVAPSYSPEPAQEYNRRWGIETLFGALKSRGFNLEDTHLKDPARLSR